MASEQQFQGWEHTLSGVWGALLESSTKPQMTSNRGLVKSFLVYPLIEQSFLLVKRTSWISIYFCVTLSKVYCYMLKKKSKVENTHTHKHMHNVICRNHFLEGSIKLLYKPGCYGGIFTFHFTLYGVLIFQIYLMKYNKNLLNVKLSRPVLKTGLKLAVIIPGTTKNNS